ncbi:ABC transporter permease subunit [Saccharopolyspora sp. NPDC047091]|uniref:ABC transporter permease n=1 Tax=Saccharopolyspora sp. NPDC047091 TaxID=3155924 RepID=UPI0033FFE12A
MSTTTATRRPGPAVAPATAPPPGPGSWRRLAAAAWPPAAFVLLLGAGWQLMAVLADSVLMPGLGEIATRFAEIVVDGDILTQLGVTLGRVSLGFALAFAAALVVGIAMGRNAIVRRFFEPAVLLGLTVPGLVWALLCVIWFGVGLANPVLAVALSAAPALTLNVHQGIRALPGELLEMTHVYRFSLWRRLRYLWLPALQPALFSGARLGLSLSWKVIVLVEVFGLSSGVGYQLNNEFAAQSVAGVLSWTLLFGAVMALLEYGLLQNLERRLTRWRKAVAV